MRVEGTLGPGGVGGGGGCVGRRAAGGGAMADARCLLAAAAKPGDGALPRVRAASSNKPALHPPPPLLPAQGETAEGLMRQARAMYQRLADLDPLRRGYYRDAAGGRAFVVVQALGTV